MAIFRIKEGKKTLMAEVNKIELVNGLPGEGDDKNVILDANDISINKNIDIDSDGIITKSIKDALDNDFVKIADINMGSETGWPGVDDGQSKQWKALVTEFHRPEEIPCIEDGKSLLRMKTSSTIVDHPDPTKIGTQQTDPFDLKAGTNVTFEMEDHPNGFVGAATINVDTSDKIDILNIRRSNIDKDNKFVDNGPDGDPLDEGRRQVLTGLGTAVNGDVISIAAFASDVEEGDKYVNMLSLVAGNGLSIDGSGLNEVGEGAIIINSDDHGFMIPKAAIHKSAVNKDGVGVLSTDPTAIHQVLTGMAVVPTDNSKLSVKIFGSNVDGDGSEEDVYVNNFDLVAGAGISFADISKNIPGKGNSSSAVTATIVNADHQTVNELVTKTQLSENEKVLVWRNNGLRSFLELKQEGNIIKLLGRAVEGRPGRGDRDQIERENLGQVELTIGTSIAYTKVLKWSTGNFVGYTGEPDSVKENIKKAFTDSVTASNRKEGGYLVIGFYTKSSANQADSDATINYTFAFLSDYIVDLQGTDGIEIEGGFVKVDIDPDSTGELTISEDDRKLLYKPLWDFSVNKFNSKFDDDGLVLGYEEGEPVLPDGIYYCDDEDDE